MHIIVFILSFFTFLFTLYRHVKDDHLFLRKNIKSEQIFDTAFIIVIIGFIFAQIISPRSNFLFPQSVIGGAIGLFIIGKYKKLPVGRLFDFFALSFLNSLAIGYLFIAFISQKKDFVLLFLTAFIYFLISIFFTHTLLPRVVNRTLKEGKLSIYIMMIFSLFSLLIPLYKAIREHLNFWNLDNISLMLLFIISVVALIKQNLINKQ